MVQNPRPETDLANLSIAEMAQKAAKQIEQKREDERVGKLLARVSAINQDVAGAIRIVRAAKTPEDREALIADLQGPRDLLEEEKTELLNDNGVQLTHIQGLVEDLEKCDRWDKLQGMVEAAYSRGWFEALPKNERGNINYSGLRFPNFINNPELREACAALRKATREAAGRCAQATKMFRAKKQSQK